MDRKEMIEYIENEFKKIDIILTKQQTEQFCTYFEMLVEKNKVMNLTAITDFKEVVLKHFIDSCIFSDKYIDKPNAALIDIGTGAGFPGIPLKILYPDLKVTLLDSLNKRLLFLDEVISHLGLKDICTVHYRAEDGARNIELRENFDFAVSRAVANLAVLSEYCIPYVKKGGCFVSFKSGNAQEEIDQAKKAIYLLGGKIEKSYEGMLPDSDITRSLYVMRKTEVTSKKYPRKAGMPSKQPLGQ